MADSIRTYYDYTIPQGEYKGDSKVTWSNGNYDSLTLTPDTSMALYVARLKFLISNDFVFGSGDEISITINAYDNVTPQEITASSIEEMVAQGDPRYYMANRYPSWDQAHQIVWVMTPPIYLRSSTSPSETVVIDYVESGGISTGTCIVICDCWTIVEEESGLS